VTADDLAVGKQRRNRFAEGPNRLAVGASFALIDLRAFGMHRQHDGRSRCCDGVGEGRFGCRRADLRAQQK
jgi:hypothetical protein